MSEFLKQIDAFRKKAELACKLIVANTALELQKDVMEDTPVRTGRAKSNWRIKVGTPEDTALYARVDYEEESEQFADDSPLDEDDYYGVF